MTRKRINNCNQQQNLLWLRVAFGRYQETLLLVTLLIDKGVSYIIVPILINKCIF